MSTFRRYSRCKNTTHEAIIVMFYSKDTGNRKKALELRRHATKNFTEQGDHVLIQNITLSHSKTKKQLDIELSQTEG